MISLSKVLKSQNVIISQIPFSYSGFGESMFKLEVEQEKPKNDESQSQVKTIDQAEIEAKYKALWEEKGREIIKKANQEAEVIRQKARQEAELLKKQAYAYGYKEGSEQKLKEIGDCINMVEDTCREIKNSVSRQLEEYKKDLHMLAIEIASKILSRNIAKNDLAINELIKKTVAMAKNSPWIEVTLSKKLEQHLQIIEKELKGIALDSEIIIHFKDVPDGTCIVENSQGVIDASLETQLNNLKTLFSQIDPYGEVLKNA